MGTQLSRPRAHTRAESLISSGYSLVAMYVVISPEYGLRGGYHRNMRLWPMCRLWPASASGSGRMVRPYLGEKRDLNSRPLAPQTRALPTELFSPV